MKCFEIDVAGIKERVEMFEERTHKLNRKLRGSALLQHLREMIAALRETVSIT